MKRFIAFFTVLLLCLSLVSCDLAGIGSDGGREEGKETVVTNSLILTETVLDDTGERSAILVDWMDFIRVGGEAYDGGFENREIDESRVGEKLGEILYTVKSYYESQDELDQADKRDFTAAFRAIGCEIFAVKDDENSIAVLDRGKYYLYTRRIDNSIPFEVFGGEGYYLPGDDDKNYGFTINRSYELGECFCGCEEPTPEELAERYGGDKLNDITLVVVRLVSGWGGTEFGISSVSKSGDDILVNAVQFDSDADGDDAMHYWTFFIEIPKTDDKEVIVNVNKVKPLETDSELAEISYSLLNNYICHDPEVDLGRYEGKAVYNKGIAEELARSTGAYGGYSAFVRFCPTNNYWLVSLSRFGDGSSHIVDIVIRAADGKIISQIEAIGCS